ncbi:conserved hypothetical protein [Theileria orientalis strain Shintoku]|uniref:Uncharacterized protein n=1 Tax=Theileria orientalis strain Shintoku TaxID=869250 RepID=J4DQC0_THEOR|nr:conserved hypothetical protein [Theileria orientalis strain Shintoku]PVC54652.1 hypothetical protein MACL_00001159 [Theileria orientalis]BAM42189.1 conserved hypothetical protein [Theileria orientalis strain Shintoku]|eukprot:XP_009692490.1 conserved hypothetical protein [Theileria orientalis strain Shintoku]
MYDQRVYESVCRQRNRGIENEWDEKEQMQSTYRADFVAKELPEREARKTETRVVNLPFEGISTYMRDYKAPEMVPVERRAKEPEREKLPFEGVSTYTLDFSIKAWEYFGKT